jgi:hypothetical protein
MVRMYHTIDLGRAADLTDDELVRSFEALTLDPQRFAHVDHVRLAFVYLREHGLLETLRRYSDGLKRFATHLGAPDKYHETVTWALIVLVHERMASGRSGAAEWPSFAAENPDLLRWRDGVFFERYGPEILESELARRTFVLPNR